MKTRKTTCLILLLAAAMMAASCSKKTENIKEKKAAEAASAGKSAAQPAQNNAGGQAVAPGSAPKAAPILVITRTPKKLLADLPCKFDSQQGVFAAFPDNPIAGQQCFSLYAASQRTQNGVVQFDIQGGGLAYVFHGSMRVTPGSVRIMKWRLNGGAPCFDAGCGAELAAKVESMPDNKNSGWTYTVVTPKDTINLAADNGGFYGLVDKSGGSEVRYLPVFK